LFINEYKTLLAMSKKSKRTADYSIVDPHHLYHGKSYSDCVCDWFNWFLSANADNRNSGPVVFLSSHGLPNKLTGAYTPDVPEHITGSGFLSNTDTADPKYQMIYVNDPNIRIGRDKLRIFEDQAVLAPIITAYVLASKAEEGYIGSPYVDLGAMQEFTGLTIDNGDDPPEPSQLTINNNAVRIPANEMRSYRITTPIFTAVVPDAPYGTSIKDFLEEGMPIPPGNYPALVEGYFVLIQFDGPGDFWIHSWASAGREVRGPYFSELLYQIEVVQRPKNYPHGRITYKRPPRNESVLKRVIYQKMKVAELTNDEITRFETIYNSLSPNQLIIDRNTNKLTIV
jgi:hypothetical protein